MLRILESDRPQNERSQNQKHRQIKTGKACRIERRPRGKDRTAAQDEPYLVAFPNWADRIDRHAPLDVIACDEWQQRGGPKIEAVHDSKADEQDAEQRPPD